MNITTTGTRHVGITAGMARQKLTPDQRSVLIIIEDVSLRFAAMEVLRLSRMQEVQADGYTRSYCTDFQNLCERRYREIRRGWGEDRADGYEDRLQETVEACRPEYKRLMAEMRTALVQRIPYMEVERCIAVAVASGMLDSCARAHEWLTGRKQYYADHFRCLDIIDRRMEVQLLNDGKLPDMTGSKDAFAKMFQAVCDKTIDNFTTKTEKQGK